MPIWSLDDPVPFIAYMFLTILPRVAMTTVRHVWSRLKAVWSGIYGATPSAYKQPLEKENSHG